MSENRASVRVAAFTLALVAVPFAAVGVLYVAQAAMAFFRQRTEARGQVTFDREQYRESFERERAATESLRGQLGEALRKRDEATSRLAGIEQELNALRKLHAKPSLSFAVALFQTGEGKKIVRLSINNDGPQDIEPPVLVNVLFPTSWGPFGSCDANGKHVPLGGTMPSDEPLKMPDGVTVQTSIWVGEFPRRMRANVAAMLLFRISDDVGPGQYPLSIRVPGYARHEELIYVPDSHAPATAT